MDLNDIIEHADQTLQQLRAAQGAQYPRTALKLVSSLLADLIDVRDMLQDAERELTPLA